MKSLWKTSAVLAVAMGASMAHADVTGTSTTTGSSLVLFVRDVSEGAATNRVYARDLGTLLDSVLTQPGAGDPYTGPVQQINFSIPTVTADSTLTAFLGGGTNFVWTIMAADTAGGGALQQRYLTTTQLDFANADQGLIPNNGQLRGSWNAIAAMYTQLNVALPDTVGSSTAVDGLWGQSGTNYANMIDWNSGGVPNTNDLGSSANLYVAVTSAAATGNGTAARIYQGLSVELLANGTLQVTPSAPPEVPLPPAIYLLGSAVAALTGVARRRKGEQAKA